MLQVKGGQSHLIRARLCATFPGGLPPPRTPPVGPQEPRNGLARIPSKNNFSFKNRSDSNGFRRNRVQIEALGPG